MMFPVTDRHNQERIPRTFGSGPFYGLFDAFHGNSVSEFKENRFFGGVRLCIYNKGTFLPKIFLLLSF